jgi:hypothetical protein
MIVTTRRLCIVDTSMRDNAARDLGIRDTYPFGFLISLHATTRHSRTHPPRRLRARIRGIRVWTRAYVDERAV